MKGGNMKYFIGFVCITFGIASFASAETVTFGSSSKQENGETLMLTGKIRKPSGDGPFAAIVLMHGCTGVNANNIKWAKKFVNWGYVTLQVYSLRSRGSGSICKLSYEELGLWLFKRAPDAHDAKSYLAEQPYVDKNRIAVIGWSHGAGSILKSIDAEYSDNRGNPFGAAIAFYPYCYFSLENIKSPLLILIGEGDNICPAELCKLIMATKPTKPEAILKIYPNAGHGFDYSSVYLDEAADADVQVESFLKKPM